MANQKNTIQDQINLVGEGTVFEGTLRAESDVRASGRVVGKLEVEGKAIVAESGVVDGEIVATNADIAGQVQGEIHVTERLVLKSTARVDGNIQTDRLVVEEGAKYTGECRMGEPVSIDSGSSAGASDGGSGSDTRDLPAGSRSTSSSSTKAHSKSGSGSGGSGGSSSKGDSSKSDSSKSGSSKSGASKSSAQTADSKGKDASAGKDAKSETTKKSSS